MNIEKAYRKNCISCFIARKVIEEYGQIYNMRKEDIEKDENKSIIEELAGILAILGKLEEKYAVLKRLSKSRPEDSSELLKQQNLAFDESQDDKCLVNLQKIISAIKCFYTDDIDTDTICDKVPYKYEILSLMHKENQDKKNIYREHYNKEKGEEALKKYNAKRKEQDGTKEIEDGLEYIFDFYRLYTQIESCNMYNREKCFFKIAKIVKDENEEKQILLQEGTDYFNRVSLLPQEKQNIIWKFLKQMTKNFGYNLRAVMSYKNMTDNDVTQLIPGDVNASKIEELKKNKTQPDENFLLYLCRALLVSKDVLCFGYGKSYGNWKSVLSKEGLSELQKAIKEDKEFQEIDFSKRTKVKEFARSKIIKIINNDYDEVIENNPDFFEEEDFKVYESKEEFFINIIDKEYAYILLDVLEQIN